MMKLPSNRVLSGLLVAACLVVVGATYFGFVATNNPVEEAAVKIIKYQTGIDIVVPEQPAK